MRYARMAHHSRARQSMFALMARLHRTATKTDSAEAVDAVVILPMVIVTEIAMAIADLAASGAPGWAIDLVIDQEGLEIAEAPSIGIAIVRVAAVLVVTIGAVWAVAEWEAVLVEVSPEAAQAEWEVAAAPMEIDFKIGETLETMLATHRAASQSERSQMIGERDRQSSPELLSHVHHHNNINHTINNSISTNHQLHDHHQTLQVVPGQSLMRAQRRPSSAIC